MTRYRHITEHLRRPLAAIAFLLGVFLLAEAIWVGRGGQAFTYAVAVLQGQSCPCSCPPDANCTRRANRRCSGRGVSAAKRCAYRANQVRAIVQTARANVEDHDRRDRAALHRRTPA
jgi:hypothetical protein